MGFTEFKNRIWRLYDWSVRQLFRLPRPVGRAVFSAMIGAPMWASWLVPNSPPRRAFGALAALGDGDPARGIFAEFVRRFSLALFRLEYFRTGDTAEIGALLDIREPDRFRDLLSRGGVVLMMPHAHGSIAMAEALGQRHPLLLLARGPKDDGRARWQQQYYSQMSCDVTDVRRTPEIRVTRQILGALHKGQIVLGAGDLLKKAPKDTEDKRRDIVRVTAFGEPVGAMRWPARLAARAGAPIVPIMIEQTEARLTLHLGPTIEPGDIAETTQAWMDGMTELVRRHPADWTFALDGKWLHVLDRAASDGSQN